MYTNTVGPSSVIKSVIIIMRLLFLAWFLHCIISCHFNIMGWDMCTGVCYPRLYMTGKCVNDAKFTNFTPREEK